MNKLDELLARIRFLIPTAKIQTDSNHEQLLQSHYAAVRVAHGLFLVMWHPGKSFRVLLEGDEEEDINAQGNFAEDVDDVIDFLVKYVIRRGLV